MSKWMRLGAALGVAVVVSSCHSASETTVSEGDGGRDGASLGGHSNAGEMTIVGGAAAGEGGNAAECLLEEACCAVPDHMPCRSMTEVECGSLEYCKRVYGVPYDGEPTSAEGGAAAAGTYLGCYSVCTGITELEACTYDKEIPERCYRVPNSATPDGWARISCSGSDVSNCQP